MNQARTLQFGRKMNSETLVIIITLFLLSCSYSEMLNIASPDREKFTYFDELSKEKNIYLCKKRVTKQETQQASIEAHEYFSTELDEYIEPLAKL